MADKKAAITVAKSVRLIVPAAKAKPSPAIGQALGQLGVNMMAFCKDFNAKTGHYKDDIPLRVSFTAYPDKTFSFKPLGPFSTWMIKQACGITVGAHAPGTEKVASIHVKQLFEIAKAKSAVEPYLAATPLKSVVKSLVATCKSMGVVVEAHPRDLLPGEKMRPSERVGGGQFAAAGAGGGDKGKAGGKKK